MKIVCITTKLNFETGGGSSDENDLLFRSLQTLGNEVTVVTAYSKLNRIPKALPYTLIEEDLGTESQLGIQKGIYRLLKKYDREADCFHVDGHIFYYGAGAYRLFGGRVPVCALFNREQISWEDNVSPLLAAARLPLMERVKKKFRFAFEKYVLMHGANKIDFFEFTNPRLEESYRRFGLSTAGRSMVMGELIDWRALQRDEEVGTERYLSRSRTGVLTILYIGRMVPGKGFDLLIEAFSRVKNKDAFKVVLVGSGPEETLLRRMVEEKNLSGYITFAGYLPKPALFELMKKTDIFIQPRWRTDMSSLSLLLAVIFGIPCIVPEGGGLAWMAGEGAVTFEDSNPDDLARVIERLETNRETLTALSRGAATRLQDPVLDHVSRVALLFENMQKLTHK